MKDATEPIEAAIKSHPLCEQIVHFLVGHEHAMDTTRGIAKCWVNRDEIAVKSALDRLVAVGVIISQSLSSGTYYSLTSDAELRAWLKANQQSFEGSRPVLLGEGTDQPLVETGA